MPSWDADVTELLVSDPATRGELTIADRVVDKIAVRATLGVPGVLTSGSGLDKVVGRRLPKVTTNTRGAQTRVAVDIAVTWPRSAAETAGAVRAAVDRAVTALAGLHVLAVDVTVVKLAVGRSPDHRRVE